MDNYYNSVHKLQRNYFEKKRFVLSIKNKGMPACLKYIQLRENATTFRGNYNLLIQAYKTMIKKLMQLRTDTCSLPLKILFHSRIK